MSIVTYNNRSIANISAIPGAAESLTHIKTLTASSSATLSFVDGSSDVVLDSTYPIYLFKIINAHPATDRVGLTFQFSTDTGSNYNTTITSTNFRAYHNEDDSSPTLAYNGGEDLAQSTNFMHLTGNDIGNANDENLCAELYLFNPSSTTFVKHFIGVSQCQGGNEISVESHIAGYSNTTSAIDAVQFKMSSGNIDAGTIKLYGLKDS
jgi:hypothetical protein